VGAGYAQNELSDAHRLFLANSGAGEFLGGWPQADYQPEKIFESYYNANLAQAAWLTFDFQRITNPGYNPARGPVQIYSARLHFEY
jgi:high affinity Mn2+ porin